MIRNLRLPLEAAAGCLSISVVIYVLVVEPSRVAASIAVDPRVPSPFIYLVLSAAAVGLFRTALPPEPPA
jgi:hypothetical protein